MESERNVKLLLLKDKDSLTNDLLSLRKEFLEKEFNLVNQNENKIKKIISYHDEKKGQLKIEIVEFKVIIEQLRIEKERMKSQIVSLNSNLLFSSEREQKLIIENENEMKKLNSEQKKIEILNQKLFELSKTIERNQIKITNYEIEISSHNLYKIEAENKSQMILGKKSI